MKEKEEFFNKEDNLGKEESIYEKTDSSKDGTIKISLKTLVLIVLGSIVVLMLGSMVHLQIVENNRRKITSGNGGCCNTNTTRSKVARDDTDTAKPIIYIYPEEETEVQVKLGNPENLTCVYPKYEDGWNVVAKPNGELQDKETGRKLYALYWEGQNAKIYDYTDEEENLEGFVVKGEYTAEFLEEKLEILGLNERESEEFIVYWLPQMEKNKYNYIRFETKEEIEKEMPLEIEPKPDTVIRVLMDWKSLDEEIEVKEQKLEKIERKGYTVVEWGGSRLDEK